MFINSYYKVDKERDVDNYIYIEEDIFIYSDMKCDYKNNKNRKYPSLYTVNKFINLINILVLIARIH